MRYEHVWTACHAQAWAILPEKLAEIEAFLTVKANGGEISAEEIQALRIKGQGDGGALVKVGSAGIIPITGTITFRSSMISEASGGTSTQALSASLREAMADDQIKTIVLDINSPGGTVPGVDEFASDLRSARDTKKVIAQVSPLAASAAYWIAAQASEIVAMPSAQVGSIGVYAMHADRSEQMRQRGIKVTYISSVPGKVEGNEFEPLSTEALADIQQTVDEAGAMFEKAVAAGRSVPVSTVRKSFGQGRLLTAQRAKVAGMIDRVGTIADTLARANGRPSARRAEDIHTIRDFEDHLRDVGFSANQAKAIAAAGFKQHEPVTDSRDETGWEDAGSALQLSAMLADARRILTDRR